MQGTKVGGPGLSEVPRACAALHLEREHIYERPFDLN